MAHFPDIILKPHLRDQNLLHKNGPEALLLNDEHRLSRLDSSMHEELERLASSVKSDFDSHKGTLSPTKEMLVTKSAKSLTNIRHMNLI